MRTINVIAMALVMMAAVIVAAIGANAAPRVAPPEPAKRGNVIDIVTDSGKSVMIVTRARKGRLQQDAAASAVYEDAFSIALGRTFQPDGGPLALHSTPVPLPRRGALASGFVAAVDGYGGRCGFAIGGLDFSGRGGAEGLDASAALIFCAKDKADLQRLATPERIARRIAQLRPNSN